MLASGLGRMDRRWGWGWRTQAGGGVAEFPAGRQHRRRGLSTRAYAPSWLAEPNAASERQHSCGGAGLTAAVVCDDSAGGGGAAADGQGARLSAAGRRYETSPIFVGCAAGATVNRLACPRSSCGLRAGEDLGLG